MHAKTRFYSAIFERGEEQSLLEVLILFCEIKII